MSWGTFGKLNLNLNKKAVGGVKGAYEQVGKMFPRWQEQAPRHRKGFIQSPSNLDNLITERPTRRRLEYW
jgi:hypothetical protein